MRIIESDMSRVAETSVVRLDCLPMFRIAVAEMQALSTSAGFLLPPHGRRDMR